MLYLITGASRGIGFATAQLLAQDPTHTILVASRNTEKLKQLADSVNAEQGRRAVHYRSFDLAQDTAESLHEWVDGFGPLHGLINNAGLLINKPFRELTRADWQAMFAVNVFGVAEVIRALLPSFAKQGAHILNIGSMGGFQGSAKFPGLSAYSASKAALASLTECLAEELKEDKIAVNCLALGAVQTEMLATAFPGFRAPLDSVQMGSFLAWFIQHGHTFFNGKVLPVSLSTP
ncbi:MAG: SDR family oxidoreductase [Bacteroidetes bacterium]|nr:MAG: SDR family oxidoreductase [Bacteroidota bacterium]